MSIETGLRTHLINDTDVAALVANSDSPTTYRIYPLRLPQGYTLPAISYQRISADRTHTLSGPIGRVWPRFQVDCWAESYSTVRDLADKVRLALDGHKGSMGGESNVGGVHLMGEHDLFEEATEIHRVTLDFSIPYFELTI